MFRLDVSDFEKFANELVSKYPVFAIESAEPAMNSMANFLLGKIPEYPPETLNRLLPPDGVSWLRTDKMRRFFFAAVRSGRMPGWTWSDGHPQKVGGARTGNLGRAQSQQTTVLDDGVVSQLGFDSALAPYAPWVVGDDYPGEIVDGRQMYQARIHVDNWWQFRGIIEENVEQGWAVFEAEFWERFSELIQENRNALQSS